MTEEIVLITSIPFDSGGSIYRIFFNFSGKVRFEAIRFWNLSSYSFIGSDL